jgi:hypothetical protein
MDEKACSMKSQGIHPKYRMDSGIKKGVDRRILSPVKMHKMIFQFKQGGALYEGAFNQHPPVVPPILEVIEKCWGKTYQGDQDQEWNITGS